MAYLIVEKGNKEDLGKNLPLDESAVLIGCPSSTTTPDLSINNRYVSRRHAEITYCNGQYMLRDIGSLNGTEIDGHLIESEKLYPLMHNSTIGLAVVSGEASTILRFIEDGTIPQKKIVNWLTIDEHRKEIRIDGRLVELTPKEYNMLVFLSHRADRFCSRDEIIPEIWPEAVEPGAVSDATIAQLIHRLKKKIEIDVSTQGRIRSKPGFGYMLVTMS